MITNDWPRAAADEICDEVYKTSGPGTGISSDEMVAIIVKHAPRCDTCKHWTTHPPHAMSRPTGDCGILLTHRPHQVPLKYATCEDFGCVRWEAKS